MVTDGAPVGFLLQNGDFVRRKAKTGRHLI
jgi:hypothetical protein